MPCLLNITGNQGLTQVPKPQLWLNGKYGSTPQTTRIDLCYTHHDSWTFAGILQGRDKHRRDRGLFQEEGVLFLPFEQRMTRDMQQRRDRRAARRLKGTGAPSLGSSASEAWPGAGLGSDTSKASLLQDMPSGPSDAAVHPAVPVHARNTLAAPSRMTHGCRP